MVAVRSGCAIAHDFGAISPITRCRNVTTASASTKPAASATHSGAPQVSISGVSQWCTAGLVVAPRASVQAVIPSCEPASRSESSVLLRNAARADLLVVAASSRRCRRAAINANSMATKNALSAIRPNGDREDDPRVTHCRPPRCGPKRTPMPDTRRSTDLTVADNTFRRAGDSVTRSAESTGSAMSMAVAHRRAAGRSCAMSRPATVS